MMLLLLLLLEVWGEVEGRGECRRRERWRRGGAGCDGVQHAMELQHCLGHTLLLPLHPDKAVPIMIKVLDAGEVLPLQVQEEL